MSSPTPESASTAEAVDVFEKTCLASLPDFSNFSVLAEKYKLNEFRGLRGIKEAHQLPGKFLFVGLVESPAGTTCIMTVDSEDNAEDLGQAVLSASLSSTNSTVEKRHPSSFFEYAVQLSNASLLTQDLRSKNGPDRSIIFVTGPVSNEQIGALIYN